MPGYADWKTLYKEEYYQRTEEGFDVAGVLPQTDDEGALPLPDNNARNCSENTEESEKFWKNAYDKLIAVTKMRDDFEYVEPTSLDDILSQAPPAPKLSPLKDGEYADRLAGAVYGRVAGVVLGKPLELGMNNADIERYLRGCDSFPPDGYVPEFSRAEDGTQLKARADCIFSTKNNVRFAQTDDDINYTVLSMILLEKHGENFTAKDVGFNWLDNVPYHWFWCASRMAYYHMVNLDFGKNYDEQVAEIPLKLNPWRECIDGQIRCDGYGYVRPGEPLKAAATAYRDCSFSLIKNGVYGGMFVAACVAGALTRAPDANSIIECGLSVVPRRSRLYEAIEKVCSSYRKTRDFNAVCNMIYDNYGHLPFAATINNLSFAVLAILHGNLDYDKTITSALLCGTDTDCNAGTAGSIIGAAVGYGAIDKKWIEPLNDSVKTCVAAFGDGKISDVVKRYAALKDAFAFGQKIL